MSSRFRSPPSLALALLSGLSGMAPACAGQSAAVATTTARPASSAPAKATGEPAPAARRFVSPYSYEWFIRAELYAAQGQYPNAVEAYQMALTSAEEDPYLFARLAEAADHAGDAEAASRALQSGLELDASSEAVWLARARIAERHGELADALEAYERAEAAAPRAPDAPLALAALLRRTGHPERADAVVARFTARNPAALQPRRPLEQDPRVELDAALAFQDSARIEHLLAETPPDQLGGPVAVAEAYLAIDQPARALEQLAEQSTAVDPDPHRRTLAKARALLLTGQPAQAATLAAVVPAASAHYTRAREVLAQALRAAALPSLADEVQSSSPLDDRGHE